MSTIRDERPLPLLRATRVGIDIGTTLCKIAIADESGHIQCKVMPSAESSLVAGHVHSPGIRAIALTGGGAARLAELMDRRCRIVGEFECWRLGIEHLLSSDEFIGKEPKRPFLVVSMGTGTLVFKIADLHITRVASTTIGGGTILALGQLLLGISDFDALCALAAAGEANNVDLRISDVYPNGGFDLPGSATSVAFGKVASGTAG